MTLSSHATFRRLLLAATVLAAPLMVAAPSPARAQAVLGVSIQIAPPLLPVYVQPPMPDIGYVWTPGYWAYGQVGYYWVPGTWIQPPMIGVLWTPPYWGWVDGAYLFHAGYWGPHVGFYGGVNYGYGYGGNGYDGGRWDGDHFAYNRSANNFGSVHVQNAYQQSLAVANRTNVSYAGGTNGTKAEPTPAERSAETERHTPATAEQSRHIAAAAGDPALAASHNNGHPTIAATSRPAEIGGSTMAHAPVPGTATGAVRPAGAAHTAEHAEESATAVHPAAAAAVAHPEVHTAKPAIAAHPTEHPPAPAAAAHSAERPAQPAAPHPAVAQAVAHPVEPAAVHPAATAHPVAAPRAAPAHEEKPEEKK